MCVIIAGWVVHFYMWVYLTILYPQFQKDIRIFFPHGNGHLLGLSLSFLEHCGDSKDYEQYEKEPVPVVPMRWLIHMVDASR